MILIQQKKTCSILFTGCYFVASILGARNEEEAVRIARLHSGRLRQLDKIEVVSDNKYLMPDNLKPLSNRNTRKRRVYCAPYMSLI
jgi:thiazole synthase